MTYLVTTPGCTTCKPVMAILEELAPEYGLDYEVVELGTSPKAEELAIRYRIMTSPTIVSEHFEPPFVLGLKADRAEIEKVIQRLSEDPLDK